ncbi:MAG: glutamate cyclase domain-containing protein, partial [Candidatus Dormibacteraceae bacterium]
TRPWISTAHIESDGPPGTMVLARVLAEALGLRLLLVGEEEVLPPLVRLAGEAGAVLRSRSYSLGGGAGEARALLLEEAPAALISVERLGRNNRGVFHSSSGRDLSSGKATIDTLFEMAQTAGIPTLGVGDGGNEIGMGAIADTVRRVVPFAARCACGCGGGIAAVTATEVLVTGGTSNWAACAISDLVACSAGRPDLVHSGADEERLLRFGVELGLVNGLRGTVDPDVDAIPLAAHRGIADLLATAALREVAD